MTPPIRDHILAAAAHLYGEHGFRGTTTRRIAEEAGVNEVTLFRLYGTKTALLLEAMRVHGANVPTAQLPDVPVDPVRELSEWCVHKRRSLSQMRALIRKAMSEFEENPEMPKCMTQGATMTFRAVRDYLTRVEHAGFTKPGADIGAATTMLISALFEDAVAREMMPQLFPSPSSAAPASYARLCLQSLGFEASVRGRRGHGRRRALAGTLLLAASALAVSTAHAQDAGPGAISLADALRLAERTSHTVRTAEAGVLRARGGERQTRSQYLPQLTGSVAYQRILESQFAAISNSAGNDTTTSGSGGNSGNGNGTSGSSLANSPIAKIFAAPNTMILGVTLTQNVFTAGRLAAATKGAEAASTAAEIGLDAAHAQLALDVAQAYFDAVASERLVEIADSTLAQTERTLRQTEVSRQVGSAAEFDLLRATVARGTQRPQVIQARGNRDIAFLRLRQLLGIPLGQPLTLTTPIRDEAVQVAEAPPVELSRPIEIPGSQQALVPDTSVSRRSSVRQAEANVTAQEFALRAQRWSRLPTVQLSSNYQRFGYPSTTVFPNSFGLFYPNWTVSLGVSFPVFTGGRIGGDGMVAEANVAEAKQSLDQVRELAALDAQTALTQLEQADANYAASVGTDVQAARAYSIAEVRFNEGISTQVELLQSRTQLEQARLNRVLAARDLEVARLRLAFLKDLPVRAR
ncbi:MAG: TolC family protein [Gemmatimonadales bacterium]